MIIALIDNGSLEPAATRNLRAVATALFNRRGIVVEPVSWKHSDRIAPGALDGVPAVTLAPWVRTQVARGESDFLLIPFFVSAQGAIGSALRSDLEKLATELGGFSFAFTDGLAARGNLVDIVVARVRETLAKTQLSRPSIIVVDHGGPSSASAALRDTIAAEVRARLAGDIGSLAAASMEGEHGPLLAEQLAAAGFAGGDVIVAPLFLSPGRHAGPDGDLAQIAHASPARVHFTDLVGTHSAAIDALARVLGDALTNLPPPLSP